MAQSMTGYGRGEAGDARLRFRAEVRAVNHRFAEVVVRLPRDRTALEERARRLTLSEVKRGRLDVLVSVHGAAASSRAVHIDSALAKAYHQALKELADALKLAWHADLPAIASLPGVLEVQEAEPDVESDWLLVEAALRAALRELRTMREAEGRALAADLADRAADLEGLVERMAARGPLVVAEHRDRLARRLEEWLPGGAVEPSRLAQEVALLAERCAVDEELVRVRSHLRQLRAALAEDGPVGRRCDFIVQELHREVNTIGSKSADAELGLLVVEAKAVVERLREQVQNIE